MGKPSLFVGSSSEGLEFARAARSLLAADAEVTLWNEGFFGLGTTFIESLVNALPRFDFAILVLTPDDLVNSRQVEAFGPRDNVIFELGLFMGHLGRPRTFILVQSGGSTKLPTDLSGVSTAGYDWPRDDRSHRSAVGPACDRIRVVIRDLGISESKAARQIGDIRSRQDDHERRISTQAAEIRYLQVALTGIVTRFESDKLEGLARDEPFWCYYSDDMMDELRRLRAMGLIRHLEGKGITVLRNEFKDRDLRFDLHGYFRITDEGREYLKLRDELQRSDADVR